MARQQLQLDAGDLNELMQRDPVEGMRKKHALEQRAMQLQAQDQEASKIRNEEMQKVLKQVGIRTLLSKNELKIFGKGMINANNKKIIIPNLGDHRIAMSAFVLASLTGARAKIKNFETVFTSSPSFLKIMKFLGAKFEKQK